MLEIFPEYKKEEEKFYNKGENRKVHITLLLKEKRANVQHTGSYYLVYILHGFRV